jgi:hypothetical protein
VKHFILKFLLPVLVAGGYFGWLVVYRGDWDAATYFGSDPWGLFFVAMGEAFVPTAVALLAAVPVKLFKRDASVLNTWLTVFLIAFSVFAVSGFTVARYERESALSLKSNAILTVLSRPNSRNRQRQLRSMQVNSIEEGLGERVMCFPTGFQVWTAT